MRHEVRIGGIGGQGAITAGNILGEAASLYDKKHVSMTEDYSPYVTGGWSKADLVISDEPIGYPLVSKADVLIALSQDTFDKYWDTTKPKGLILVEKSIVDPSKAKDRRILAVPAIDTAEKLGRRVVANVVMLGAFTAASKVLSEEAIRNALAKRFPRAVDLNKAAFDGGAAFVRGST